MLPLALPVFSPTEPRQLGVLLAAYDCVALAAVGSFLLARRITRPMTALSAAVGHIVHQQDLTQPLPVPHTQDEMGELARAISQLVLHLRETTASLQHGMRVLITTAAGLHAASRQQEVVEQKQHVARSYRV